MTGLLWLVIWWKNFQKKKLSYFHPVVTFSVNFRELPWS